MRMGYKSGPIAQVVPGRSAKMMLLRGRGGEGSEREGLGTSEMRLDLQAPLDNLRSLIGDLEVFYWERPGEGEMLEAARYQIGFWIRQVSERAAALQGILLHMGTPAVVLTGVNLAEREALRGAANRLDRWIPEGEPFEGALRIVAAILNAADLISLKAAGGRPAHGLPRSDTPEVPRK